MAHALSEEIAHPTVYHHISGLFHLRSSGGDGLETKNKNVHIPADYADLVQVISCSSVSCLINTEQLELLSLQPSEPIASESVAEVVMEHI